MNPLKSTIYLGADHAGFELKEVVLKYLQDNDYAVEDLSPGPPDPQDDYPDIAEKVAKKVLADQTLGILLCGSGNGMCTAANKIKGIQAAVGYNIQAAKWAKTDGNTDILCLAGRVLSPEYATAIVKHWLETPPAAEERHLRRIGKIKKLEENGNGNWKVEISNRN